MGIENDWLSFGNKDRTGVRMGMEISQWKHIGNVSVKLLTRILYFIRLSLKVFTRTFDRGAMAQLIAWDF